MTLKIWRGDAPAVAQVTTVTPANVEIGDVFALIINGKSVSFTATAATASNVCDGLAAAIAASDIQEFGEFTAESANGVLTLTAATAGVPFVVTSSTTNAGASSVVVATTNQGGPPASEVQTFTIPSGATGTWTVAFGGQVTGAIAMAASAATVQTALEGLSTIGAGQVTVARTSDTWAQSSYIYEVTFGGTLANTSVGLLVVALYNASPIVNVRVAGSPIGPVNEVVSILFPDSDVDAFTFNLTFASETSANRNYTSGSAILGYPVDWPSSPIPVVTYEGDNRYEIEFTDSVGSANVGAVTSSATWSAAQGRFDIAVTVTTEGTAGGDEVQTITLTPTPTGGTFTLTYDGQTTSAIAFDASAATVDAALEALSNIGAGDVAVTGSAGGPWTVTFGTALADTNVAEMTGDGSALTGASSQTLTVTDVTDSEGPNHWDTAANWSPVGVPATSDDVRFEIGDSDCLYGLDQTGVTLASLHVAMTYTGKIGLPRVNDLGYFEYRVQALTCGITDLMIGQGNGSGPSKVNINTLAVQTTIEIRGSGGSSESGIPTITWRGSHASNDVVVLDGDFGTSPYSDQSAVINELVQRGGNVALKHTTLDSIVATNQSITAYDCTLSGGPLEL